MDSERQLRLLALCAISSDDHRPDWNVLARQALLDGGLEFLYEGVVLEQGASAEKTRAALRFGLTDLSPFAERAEQELARAQGAGARLVTVMDEDYPANLRLIPNLPPFLFYKGELRVSDARAVAVVGTRKATSEGLRQAGRIAHLLAERAVTVVSGLAVGVDTAAHQATLQADGRTIAVLGTGILHCYPPQNRDLAESISDRGALVSQFWPSTRPATWTFPRRNVVGSGISQGTVVIEASSTSGAKMQARIALEHNKHVWLLRSLVTHQEWAKRYVATRGAVEVDSVDQVVADLADPERLKRATDQRRQLAASGQMTLL